MRVLTVRQPWAWAIWVGAKTVENRTGSWSYRGPVAILGGKGWSERGYQDSRVRALMEEHECGPRWDYFFPDGQPYEQTGIGAIAELVDVHPAMEGCCEPWGETTYVDAAGVRRSDVNHLVFESIVQLERPLPARGALGLRRPDPELRAVLEDLWTNWEPDAAR